MASRRTIDIGKDFSEVPGGRHHEDGPHSGQRFREELLVPALRKYDVVEVLLDNTEGYGSSFLDEAFGGLIRDEGFTRDELSGRLVVTAIEARAQRYKRKIQDYLNQAHAATGH